MIGGEVIAGNLEKLSVVFETNISQYRKDMSSASSATKGWASDTEKARASAETAAKKSQSAFSRISQAIRGTRKEASKGAEFEVRANDNAFSKITNRIKAVRSDVNKGADFAVRADERGFSGLMKRIGALRSDANKGASFDLRASESGLSKIGAAIGSIRADANKGATFNLKASESGLSGIKSAISSARTEAGKGATFKLDTGQAESAASGLKSTLKDVGAVAAGVVIGDAAGGGIDGLSTSFQDASKSAGMLQAQLGGTKKESEALKGVGLDVYTSNWGDSIGETTNALGLVQQGLSTLGASKSELQGLTESTFIMRDAFGIDTQQSIDAVRQMTQNFGISGQKAFDLVTKGAQGGANAADDLTDSVREYSPFMAELGLNAKQQMGIYVESMKAGARNTDLVGDAVKEFSIRAQDGSDLTSKGFRMAGLDAKKLSGEISKGGPAAEKAFQQSLKAILSIEDPIKREQAGVALFGTKWEDLGPKVFEAMAKGTKGIGNVEGATKRAGDAMSDNLGSKIAGVKRQFETFVSEKAGASFGEITSGAGQAGIAIGGIGLAIPTLWGAAAGAWGLATAGWAALAPFAVAAAPFALAAGAVTLLAGGFFLAYNKSERFRAGVDKLDTALIGTKNTAEITKNGWKGVGNVASDNSGISILWAKDLGKVEAGMRQNKEAATPFNKAMLDLGQRMRDNKGISGGLSGIWRSMKTTMTDNKGVSDLWAKGTGNLTSKLTDNKGASGALRGAWAGLKQRAMDNKGASAAWAGGLEGLRKRISDNKGVSSAWSGGLAGLRKRLTDNKGASGALSGALSGLKNRLTDNKGASGALKTALGSLKEKAVGAGAGFVTLRNQGLAKLGELKNKGITLAGNLGTGAVKRFEEMRSGSRGKFQQQTANGIAKFLELKNRGGENIRSFVKGGLDKYTEMRKGGATRFEALRGAVVGRLTEAKDRGIARTHELGTGLKESWGRQWENAKDKFSDIRGTIGSNLSDAKERGIARTQELGTELKASWGRQWDAAKDKFSGIRGTIGSNLSDAKDRGIEHMKTLGGGLRDAFGRFLTFTGGFGDKFKTLLGDKFGGAINLARYWLGGLMKAVANVLGAFGADGLSGDARSLGGGLQEPLKFARGGITNPNDGYGIVGEAGQREAVVNLEQRTPESVAALRAANASPNAGVNEDRGHRGLPEPPGEKRRRERERLEAPLTKSTNAGGGAYTGWDHVVDSGGYAQYAFNTSFGSAYDRALSAWDDGKSPIDMRTGPGVKIADGYYGTGEAPAWTSSSSSGITNNRTLMDGYTSDQNNAIATHEVGHTLGLGHGVPAPSIMNYDSTYNVGGVPTSNDWSYLQKLWGTGPGGGSGGGKSDPSGDHEETNLKNYSSNFDSGTQPHVARVANYMNDKFPAIDVIGGYRPGDPQDHGKGLAIDMMTGPLGSSGNNGLMDSITEHMKANWDAMAVSYLISRQRIDTGSGWAGMENRGDNTQNHMDHVHASFSPEAGSGIVSGAGGGGGGMFDWLGAITSGLAKVGTPEIGLGMVGDGMKSYAGTLLGKAKDFLIDKAKGVFGGVKDTLGDAYNKITGGGDPAKNRAMGQEMFPQSGLSGSFSDVDAIWTQESGWDHTAQNPDSTAFGIPQFLDATWQQYGGKSTDPKGQIDKGYSYIGDRYDGSASKALDFKRANGWYERGGVIPGPKGKEVMLQAHAGERVLSEKNNVAFERLANSVELWSSRQQGAKAVEIRQTGGDSSAEMSREELRAIRSELAAMRRTLAQEIGNEVGGKLMGKPGERNQLRHTKNVNERHKVAGLIV